ncbi:MAG: hypothetical protein ACK5NK_01220 [Niabella sp.]
MNFFQAGVVFLTKSRYCFDIGFSMGPDIVLGDRNVTINNEPYKIKSAPAYFLGRFVVGRKF